MATNTSAPEVRGKRALVYSMGIEGRDLARWLLANGASVTMSDTRTEAALQAAGATAPEGVASIVSGQPFLDPEGFDLVAVSQSVLRYDRALIRARELGIEITSQMRLFLQLCPGKVVGITGSSGKSTTTALVGSIAAEAKAPHIVGGNIGEALLGRLDEITPNTTVILEISHTQLQYTERSPGVAAITNITPNHLDQFSWDEYVGLKRNLLAFQKREDIAVLNLDDKTSTPLFASARAQVVSVSSHHEPERDGAWLAGHSIFVRRKGIAREVAARGQVRLRGEHNISNVVMACGIASAAGLPMDAFAPAISAFRGVAHRLELAGRASGATWVNDSIATSPERAMAGLRAFTEPVVLLLGGRDKNLPLDGLQALAKERCRAVICFGESAELFADAMRPAVSDTRLVWNVEEAVNTAAKVVRAGDVVLFSPAGTSFDAYPSFEVRGAEFRRLVAALPGYTAEVTP